MKVTREHGDTFVESLIQQIWDTGAHADAFAETELKDAPVARSNNRAELIALDAHTGMVDEICTKAFEAIRQPLAEAFVAAAAEVLARDAQRAPGLEIVDAVTRAHAAKFADLWVERTRKDVDFRDAIGLTRIMTYPPDGENPSIATADQFRYGTIVDEIADAMCVLLRPAVAEAFYMAASVILAGERGR